MSEDCSCNIEMGEEVGSIKSSFSYRECIENGCLRPQIISMIEQNWGDMQKYIESLERRVDIQLIVSIFECLNNQHQIWKKQEVVLLRFGLLDPEGKYRTEAEIAQMMGITEARVRQVLNSCLRPLVSEMRRRKWRLYLDELLRG